MLGWGVWLVKEECADGADTPQGIATSERLRQEFQSVGGHAVAAGGGRAVYTILPMTVESFNSF